MDKKEVDFDDFIAPESPQKEFTGNVQKDERVSLIENKYVKNIASPFINHQKNWDDEDLYVIP